MRFLYPGLRGRVRRSTLLVNCLTKKSANHQLELTLLVGTINIARWSDGELFRGIRLYRQSKALGLVAGHLRYPSTKTSEIYLTLADVDYDAAVLAQEKNGIDDPR